MKCVSLALAADYIVVVLQACCAVFDGLFALHTHVFGSPVVLLAETGVLYWFCLEIIISVAEQADIWVEAYLASNCLAGHNRRRFLIMQCPNLAKKCEYGKDEGNLISCSPSEHADVDILLYIY